VIATTGAVALGVFVVTFLFQCVFVLSGVLPSRYERTLYSPTYPIANHVVVDGLGWRDGEFNVFAALVAALIGIGMYSLFAGAASGMLYVLRSSIIGLATAREASIRTAERSTSSRREGTAC